jgi:hypothetical protein
LGRGSVTEKLLCSSLEISRDTRLPCLHC